MILITVGSQKFQFNRLLKWIDQLIEENLIDGDTIFAQTGFSDYKPKNYKYKNFLEKDELDNWYEKCDTVITHAGTASIIKPSNLGKKIIVIPRDKSYGEHIDNHQYEIAEAFKKKGYCITVKKFSDLKNILINLESLNFYRYKSNNSIFVGKLLKILDSELS